VQPPPDNPITPEQKRTAVELLVKVIRDRDLHDAVISVIEPRRLPAAKADQDPYIRSVQDDLMKVFATHGYPSVKPEHLLAVSLDYCDRDTVGYDTWGSTPAYDGAALTEAWKKECRLISAQAGGVVYR